MTYNLIFDELVFIAAGLAWVELFARRGAVKQLQQRLESIEQKLAVFREEQSDVRLTCDRLHARIDSVGDRLDKVHERQDQHDLRDPETGAYVQGIRLVQRGATAESLVNDCGLTPAEADLLIRLHRQKQGREGE